MTEKILFVDDEPNVLQAIKRRFRKQFQLETAGGGVEALETIKNHGPFAVIVSDMRMPEMDGVRLLARVKSLSPDTVRMMLTGDADKQTAIDAVNEGNIFRFLTKPIHPEIFTNALTAAIEQYRLVVTERELLNKTLNGTIKVLTEILSLVNPTAFSRAYRIKGYVKHITTQLRLPDLWQYNIAALLSQIGCVTLPGDILDKVNSRVTLDHEEQEMHRSFPLVGAKLLANIPRLEGIVRMIEWQQRPYSEYTSLPDSPQEKAACLGAQILKVVLDFDQLTFQGLSHPKALSELQKRPDQYNPLIIHALEGLEVSEVEKVVMMLRVKDLTAQMIIAEDVIAKNGILLAAKGQEVTFPVIERLQNFSKRVGIDEPFRVLVDQIT